MSGAPRTKVRSSLLEAKHISQIPIPGLKTRDFAEGIKALPSWFKQEIPDREVLERAKLLTEANVHTVCQEAKCPNLSYCFKHLYFTFMILGGICTRNCKFCAVEKSAAKLRLDLNEPLRIANIVKSLGLNYAVITSVTRDDLEDGGASIFYRTIESIRRLNKNIGIEVLIPDFKGSISSLKCLLEALPNVVAHNLETVKRLYRDLRPQADYYLSLGILKKIKELKPDIITKSSLMLGFGEREDEVIKAMEDLRANLCDVLTLGQYLAPSPGHYPVQEFISQKQFKRYESLAYALGFREVKSGPLVRSSYQAAELYREVVYV